MKKIYLAFISIFLLLVFWNITLSSAVRTRLWITTTSGYTSDKLVFGIHEKATDGLDTALNEWEAPPFHPPQGEGINAGFVIFDTRQGEYGEYIWTYLDLRPVPATDTNTVSHKIEVLKGSGESLTIEWRPMGPEILSAKLTDAYTGTILDVDMKDSTKVILTNEFLSRFWIKVKYDISLGASQEPKAEDQGFLIYPNPFMKDVVIKTMADNFQYQVFDNFGRTIKSGKSEGSTASLDFGDNQPGLYFLSVSYSSFKKIFKLIKK